MSEILESFDTDSPNLNPFLLVTFADLKKYVYHYWFAFPALVSKPGWELEGEGMTEVPLEVSHDLPRLIRESADLSGGNGDKKPSTRVGKTGRRISGQRGGGSTRYCTTTSSRSLLRGDTRRSGMFGRHRSG